MKSSNMGRMVILFARTSPIKRLEKSSKFQISSMEISCFGSFRFSRQSERGINVVNLGLFLKKKTKGVNQVSRMSF